MSQSHNFFLTLWDAFRLKHLPFKLFLLFYFIYFLLCCLHASQYSTDAAAVAAASSAKQCRCLAACLPAWLTACSRSGTFIRRHRNYCARSLDIIQRRRRRALCVGGVCPGRKKTREERTWSSLLSHVFAADGDGAARPAVCDALNFNKMFQTNLISEMSSGGAVGYCPNLARHQHLQAQRRCY